MGPSTSPTTDGSCTNKRKVRNVRTLEYKTEIFLEEPDSSENNEDEFDDEINDWEYDRYDRTRKIREYPHNIKEISIDEDDYGALYTLFCEAGVKFKEGYRGVVEEIVEQIRIHEEDDEQRVHWLKIGSYLNEKSKQEMPEDVSRLSALTTLNVCDWKLPRAIGQLYLLKELHLIGCEGAELLPEEIGDLTNLTTLRIHQTTVTTLPASIGRLKNLKELEIIGVIRITKLPEEIGDMESLTRMELKGSGIQSLPSSIGRLKNLEAMCLEGTKDLETLPETQYENMTSLTEINLILSGIKSLPASIGRLKNLEELHLENTQQLTNLPNDFFDMNSLEKLYCDGSSIRSLSYSLGNLVNLKVLDLAFADITSLPPSIGQLENLEGLVLDGNKKLLQLPEEIGSLINLKELSIEYSGITSLPSSVGNLSKLETLDLDNTGVKSIPNYFRRLTALKHLYISNHIFKKESDRALSILAQRLPKLEVLGSGTRKKEFPRLMFTLLCNKKRDGLPFAVKRDEESIQMMMKLWPYMLRNAPVSLKNWDFPVKQPTAINWLLKEGRECFVRTLLDRKARQTSS